MNADIVEVTVDPDLCMGSGTCIAVAPDLFEIGDDGTSRPVRASTEASRSLTMALDRCPAGAIQVVRTPSP